MMSDRTDFCVLCNGVGKNQFNENCTYCNGTGEPNNLAEEYLHNHICQCIMWDRKFCPVCKKECHHDTSLSPKQKIDPGYGGLASPKSYREIEDTLVM
jgi:RecJ-like exonuclease